MLFTRKEGNQILQTIGPYHLPVLEHIVNSHIMNHLSQRGFRTTETQRICTIHDIASAIQSNKTIHAAILDFSKVFDKVPHGHS